MVFASAMALVRADCKARQSALVLFHTLIFSNEVSCCKGRGERVCNGLGQDRNPFRRIMVSASNTHVSKIEHSQKGSS